MSKFLCINVEIFATRLEVSSKNSALFIMINACV